MSPTTQTCDFLHAIVSRRETDDISIVTASCLLTESLKIKAIESNLEMSFYIIQLSPVSGVPSSQYTVEYLSQLLKDKKQLAAFPNVFHHVERLVDEGQLQHPPVFFCKLSPTVPQKRHFVSI